ncbi:MAG: recombinase family protein, partial [Actinomycetota bacterium]
MPTTTKNRPSLRAAIYTRLSRDPEGTETATKRQAEACRKLCKQRGWTALTVYRDTDVSAYSKKVIRPEFQRMLSDIDSGLVDVVVVWRSDRFSRQPRDLEKFLDLADARKVQLVSVTEPFDTSNGMGLLMARQMFAYANYESAVKSERITAKHLELAKAGKWSGGGRRPFGYDKDG